jgi:RHS repeat-associated protein
MTTASTGTAAQTGDRYGFASGYLDTTGFYHYGQRYYSPTIGRWTQADPIAGTIDQPKNINRYLYGADDPINQTDPSGQGFWGDVLGTVGFSLGLASLAVPGLDVFTGSLLAASAAATAGSAYLNTGNAGFALGLGAFALVTGGASGSTAAAVPSAGFASGLLSFGTANLIAWDS